MAHVVNVDSLTLRELAWAAEGVDRAEHARLTRLEAFMASLKSKKPMRAGHMDPYRARRAGKGEVSVDTRGSKRAAADATPRTRIRYIVNGVDVPKGFFNDTMDRARRKR